MAGGVRPDNTYISNVLNPGIDKNIPAGSVDVVFDKSSGRAVGFMRNGAFYPLGVDPVEYDKQIKESPTFSGVDLGKRPTGPTGIAGEILSKGLAVTYNPSGGGTVVNDPNGDEVFIYLSTKPDAKGDYEVLIDNDYDKIRNKILSDANSTPGGINGLFSSLYASGLISKATFDSKDISSQEFNKGLAYAARSYSVKQVDNITIGGQKQIGGFTDYLGSNGGLGKPTSEPFYNSVTTLRQDAAEELDRYFMQYFGYGATKEQEDAYYLELRKLEKENVVKTTNTYDSSGRLISKNETGELVSETDKLLLLGKIAGKAIKGSNLEKIINSGAKAADSVNELIAYANKYGVELTQQDAIDYIGENLRKGLTLDSSKNKILKLSQIKYGNLSDVITDDISAYDIATPFVNRLSKLTGMAATSITVNNPLIQQALKNNGQKGTMNEADFDKLVKTNPETRAMWLQQPETKDEAASYLLNILQTFGEVA